MSNLIKRHDVIAYINEAIPEWSEDKEIAIDCIKNTASAEPDEDVVSKGLFEQIKWERDVAIDQLEELGYSLGEKPRKGEWIPSVDRWGDIIATVDGYTCSECGFFKADKDNFCPHCGADMRGEEYGK